MITSAGVVALAVAFAVFAGLPLVTVAQPGVLVGIGVLPDAFLVRTVPVPALALDPDRRFWWPGALGRRPARQEAPSVSPTGNCPSAPPSRASAPPRSRR
ncbi:hypothetical protein GCM10010095_02760 [Streptomyces anthocyanicus]|uniref:Membrane transport protein MMPL domain-containing protein n=1 Tax=Streptomyces violaceolatus TaxID=67378 RepID=A0ABN3S893_9ACTN|nr:hypothetical protein GCM10010095_02760 [Streptomyces anthocyanicus]